MRRLDSLATKSKIGTRSGYICAALGEKCPAYIRIDMDKTSELITVTKLEDSQNCLGTLQVSHGSQRDHDFLVNSLEEEFPNSKETKPKAVQAYLQRRLGIDIPYISAHKAKGAILKETSKAQCHQFQLIHAYVERLVEVDPVAIGVLKTLADEGGEERRSHSMFLAPDAACNTFLTIRKFVAVHRILLKSHLMQILLLAVRMDAEDHLVILAWGICTN
ncbi:hypothetical protein GcM1_186031 [Golovinomyces cichoracearum]|uniref:Uncharacterized protein n=1 Tax=Golovinomyces cichoracearum TaxID=62708 RepID=A0A420J301_9PEZI|nr:hypothetical protein GcM1_186031 [Golovinomyces cichoracearum]